MDDWSNLPGRNTVHEPATNHQSPLRTPADPPKSTQPHNPRPTPAATRRCPPPNLRNTPAKHANPSQHKRTLMTTNETNDPNTKNGQPALDIHRPFMDDKPLSISAVGSSAHEIEQMGGSMERVGHDHAV